MVTPDSPLTPLAASELVLIGFFRRSRLSNVSRIAAHGRRRSTTRGEVLVEVGDRAGAVLRRRERRTRRRCGRPTTAETLIVSYQAGQFSGEANMISGRRAIVAAARQRARRSDPARSRAAARAHPDRRGAERDPDAARSSCAACELIARDLGDVVVIGSTHCAGTLRVKEFLTRNGHPFHYVDLDRDRDAQELLDRFHIGVADIPGRDLPRRCRAAESDECADCRLSRVQ